MKLTQASSLPLVGARLEVTAKGKRVSPCDTRKFQASVESGYTQRFEFSLEVILGI